MKAVFALCILLCCQSFAAGSMSYDCRKWKAQPEPKDKEQYFVKDEDSVGFFNEADHFFVSESGKAPILFLKAAEVLVSVNAEDGFTFKSFVSADLKLGTAGLMSGIAELNKGAWMVSKGGERVFRIEVLEAESKFMALSCEQGDDCVAVDRIAKKRYAMNTDPDVVESAKKQFQADAIRASLESACEAMQNKNIDRDITKFENACKRKSKLKLPDRLRRQELCEEARLTLKPLFP